MEFKALNVVSVEMVTVSFDGNAIARIAKDDAEKLYGIISAMVSGKDIVKAARKTENNAEKTERVYADTEILFVRIDEKHVMLFVEVEKEEKDGTKTMVRKPVFGYAKDAAKARFGLQWDKAAIRYGYTYKKDGDDYKAGDTMRGAFKMDSNDVATFFDKDKDGNVIPEKRVTIALAEIEAAKADAEKRAANSKKR